MGFNVHKSGWAGSGGGGSWGASFFFEGGGDFFPLWTLQISKPASFVSKSLSVPSAQNCGQIFLDGHLLSIAAVAVREDPVRVTLG